MIFFDPASAAALFERLMPECRQFLKELVDINSFTRNRVGVNANAERIIGQFGGRGNAHCSESSADGTKIPEFVDLSSFVPKTVLNLAGLLVLAEEIG